MKKTIFMSLLSMSLGLFAFNSYAVEQQAAEQAIQSECKEESKNAESPEIYFEECVADRMQALRDEQGGSGDVPVDEKG